jgi:hypothetical protein
MNKDQKLLLLFSPLVLLVKCVGAIGTIVRETPKELKETYKYLGEKK